MSRNRYKTYLYVQTAAVCVIPILVCSAMPYFMVMTSYDLWKFVLVTIISLVLNQTWIAVYMMVICAYPSVAHRICPMVSAIAGFAGGFLVPLPAMPPGYNLLFYINPQFYGYAAITKVLLQDVSLNCVYESRVNCISTDGNAVLARFGFATINIYKNLAIMLGMTVLSFILCCLFLEMKYINMSCTKKSSKISKGDTVSGLPVEPLHKPLPADLRSRRKSTLRIISGELHTVKLPEKKHIQQETNLRKTSSDRSSRWDSIRRRINERKLSTELQTKTAHRMARRSIKQAQRQRRKSQEIDASEASKIRKRRSITFPHVAEESTPKTRKRNVSFDDVRENHNDVDLRDVTFKEQTRKRNVSFDDVQENYNDVDLRDVAFKEQKNDMNGHDETRF